MHELCSQNTLRQERYAVLILPKWRYGINLVGEGFPIHHGEKDAKEYFWKEISNYSCLPFFLSQIRQGDKKSTEMLLCVAS